MKPGVELAAWLADPARQLDALTRDDAFAHAAASRPLLTELKRDIEAADRSQEALRPIVERFLARDAEIQALVDELIAECAADPYFRPPYARVVSEITSGLLLFENPRLFVALSVIDAASLAWKRVNAEGGSSINFTGVPTLFKFIKAGDATLSLWEAPTIGEGFAIDQSGKCWMTDRVAIQDGDTLMIDGRHQSFVIDHARSNIVYLYAAILAEQAPVAVEYDSRTLECVGASSTDEAASRIQMMITLLRLMDRQDAVPLFVEALDNPQFYTRWHVMRELLALDAGAALPHLRAMAERDPHPDVRAAARQTLAAFFHEEGALEEAV